MEKTIVCLASYYKGYEFIEEIKKLGNKVILITSQSLKNENWPREYVDEFYYMPELKPSIWDLNDLVKGFAFLTNEYEIDAIIALDDYDVGKAAKIREVFRIPGMGQTTYRYFRDKLAMRQKAKAEGISIPEFTPVFNDNQIKRFIREIPAPWLLKPRSEASAMGIKKVNSEEELWEKLNFLGQERIGFLLESFKPGTVYHVDSLIYEGKIVFSAYSKYLAPPMSVSHDGGVFRSVTLGKRTKDAMALKKINEEVLNGFGIKYGTTHSEFIKDEEGNFYFLETASRIGGAHIPDMIEAAVGVNLWKEWARLENAVLRKEKYEVKETAKKYGGLLVSLTREEKPDTQALECPELVRFFDKKFHIIAVYSSDNSRDLLKRLNEASEHVTEELLGVMPSKDKPTD